MSRSLPSSVPLLGALLVDAGLITQEQLDVCLLLQTEDYLGIPLGQIALNCGYLTAGNLERVLHLQGELKAAVAQSSSLRPPVLADCTAVVFAPNGNPELLVLLERLGVIVSLATTWETLLLPSDPRPDLVIIDSTYLEPAIDLSPYAYTPTLIMPLGSPEGATGLPAHIVTTVTQIVTYLRAQRHHHEAIEALEQRAFELNTIRTMSRAFAAATNPDEALSRMMLHIRDLLHIEAGTLYRLNKQTQRLRFEVVFGPVEHMLHEQEIPVDEGIAGWVARNRKPLLLPDVTQDSRFNQHIDQQTGFRTRAMLCLPLISFGEVQGVLQLINKSNGDTFSDRELMLLRMSATLLALTLALTIPPAGE